MRVLFTTFAARSHFFAQVTVASALRTAGHEVLVASQPDLVDDIKAAGLTAAAVGPVLDLEQGMQQSSVNLGDDGNLGGLAMSGTRHDELTWPKALGMFTAMTSFVFQNVCPEPMVDDLVDLAVAWKPDLVVWDPLTFAAPIAATVCGAAHARLLFGPDQVARNRADFRRLLLDQPPQQRDDPLMDWLLWTLQRTGGATADLDERAVVGDWTIDPTPSSMRAPLNLHYVPVRYVPYNGPAEMPSWLRQPPTHPRRICVTLGVSLGESPDGGMIAADLMAAVDGLDVEVVATLSPDLRDRVGTLPANVRAVDFVPLNALLPSCAGIVHHGGSGTFMTALSHGVPQLIVPDMLWDSMEKAHALADSGAGVYINDPSAQQLRERITHLLDDPSFAAQAARVRAEIIGTPSPNDIVPVLEKLTAVHQRPSTAATDVATAAMATVGQPV